MQIIDLNFSSVSILRRIQQVMAKQMRFSKNHFGRSFYRLPGNTKITCPVGCLIEDQEYLISMEGLSPTKISERFDPINFTNVNLLLLEDIQILHDSETDFEVFLQTINTMLTQPTFTIGYREYRR